MRPCRLPIGLLLLASLVACQQPGSPRRPVQGIQPGSFANFHTTPPGLGNTELGPQKSASGTVSSHGYAGPRKPAVGSSAPVPAGNPSVPPAGASPAASASPASAAEPSPLATAGYVSVVGTIALHGEPVARATMQLQAVDTKAVIALSVSGADGTFSFAVGYNALPVSLLIGVDTNGPAFAGLIRLAPGADGADPLVTYDGTRSNTGGYAVTLSP